MIEEIWNQWPNQKRHVNRGTEIVPIKGQIEEIESLLINWESNCINWRPMTEIKKTANFRANFWFFIGTQLNCFIKSELNWGLDWIYHKLRTDLKVDIFWRHFLLNEIACFVQNDVISFTVHLKKTESSKRCCFEWVHLLLPWTCYKQGKKKIIPLQHLSLSLSLSL